MPDNIKLRTSIALCPASERRAREWILIPKNVSIPTKIIFIVMAMKNAVEILDTG